jgi:hypothetical protein
MKHLEAQQSLMAAAARIARALRRDRRQVARGLTLLPLLALTALGVLAASYVSYVLWPRWPSPVVRSDAPALPIIVGEMTFNIPPGAIRASVQRKPGVQERVDLAFLWPSLAPASSAAPPSQIPSADHPEPKPIERIFVTVTATNGALAPIERFRTIYPRYAAKEPMPASTGLLALAFREGTPYQGEDLIYDAADPERFFVRCTRDGSGYVPGTCLAERRMRDADLIVRFPRAWLADWGATMSGIDRLIGGLRPH